MRADLSDYKINRPSIASFFTYIEEMLEENGKTNEHRSALPYPENLSRFYRLMPLTMFYRADSQEFKRILSAMSDWLETMHKEYPTQALVNPFANQFTTARHFIENEMGLDFFTFFTCRMMECLHLAHKSPTIHYHPDLLNMLRMTDVKRSSEVPVSMIKVPYTSIYLDWRDIPDKVKDGSGEEYQGCYVQSHVISFDKIKKTGILDKDISLLNAVKKGVIRKNTNVLFFNMEFVSDNNDSEMITNNLFNIACSIDDDIKLIDAMVTDDEMVSINEDGISYSDMEEPIALVINTLLYMNTKDAVREDIKEAAGMKVKTNSIKNPAKKRKALARINRGVYDYVRIGKTFKIEGLDRNSEATGNRKSPHMRMGYFNQFYIGERLLRDENGEIVRDIDGKGIEIPKELRKSEIKWIMPTLINADSLQDVKVVKDRKIQ